MFLPQEVLADDAREGWDAAKMHQWAAPQLGERSEERRVGKECLL